MKKYIPRGAWIILVLQLTATALLMICGYGVQKPAVQIQEFPFSITYTYLGEQKTVSGIFLAEYTPSARYLCEKSVAWSGHILEQDRLRSDYIRIAENEALSLSINLNLEPGWLMGDSTYAGSTCTPSGLAILLTDGQRITNSADLEALGFRLDSWEYPEPIENRFSFGGISLSSEAVLYTSVIAIAALLLCMIFVERDWDQTGTILDKIEVVMNLLVVAFAFPFILIASTLSEILGETSALQQVLYLTPALTMTGVCVSVVLRRRGYSLWGFLIQFIGPAVFALAVLIGKY